MPNTLHTDPIAKRGVFCTGNLGELARMLQAHTAMCQLSDMQVRGALELMQQRGYRIVAQKENAAQQK